MLEYMAIGDAYGAGFEFVEAPVTPNDLTSYYAHPLHGIKESYGLPAGSYTDDTQMSIAVSLLLIQKDVKKIRVIDFADSFVSVFKADPRPGYAEGFYNFLKSVQSGEDFLNRIIPESKRNGVAMRSIPLGFCADKEDVIRLSELNAFATHRTDAGRMSSMAVALMSHYFCFKLGNVQGLTDYLIEHIPEHDWRESYSGLTSLNGVRAVHSCLDLLRHNTGSMSELLMKAIDRKGDTDTAGAICLGLASLSDEYVDDLPDVLWETIEHGKYGMDYIRKVDMQLVSKFCD